MREINEVIVHSSATRPAQNFCAEDIKRWHTDKGWLDIGYHYVIRRDGLIEAGRDEEKIGAHAKGHNNESIGVCLIGGTDEKGRPDANFTIHQYVSLLELLNAMIKKYPDATVLGHRDLPRVNKACPCFDVQSFYQLRGNNHEKKQ